MHTKFWKTGAGMLLLAVLLTVFLSPTGQTLEAFNQNNLIRVSEVFQVDGKTLYERLAPVTDMLP